MKEISNVARVSLVTGGTEGIGRAVCLELARRGDRILFVGRDAQRGREVLHALAAISDRDHRFIVADLAHVAEAVRVVREVRTATRRLDAIVCCAGVLSTIPEWTDEGLERTFALNYLSRYVLARELMPMLDESSSGRLVLVANAGLYKDTLDFADLQHRRGKRGLAVAGRSQFANDLLATELAARAAQRRSRVEVTCVFPGFVKTRVFDNARGLPVAFRILRPLLRLFSITPEVAALTPAFLAHDAAAVGTNGRFFGPRCREREVPARARNEARRALLLEASEALLGGADDVVAQRPAVAARTA